MPQKFQPARLRTLGDIMSESMGDNISESLGGFVGIGSGHDLVSPSHPLDLIGFKFPCLDQVGLRSRNRIFDGRSLDIKQRCAVLIIPKVKKPTWRRMTVYWAMEVPFPAT